MNMANVTVKDLASKAGVDDKTFRRFLRSAITRTGGTVGVNTPGRGGAYSFDEDEADAIVQEFTAWQRTRSGSMHVTLAALGVAPADDTGEDA